MRNLKAIGVLGILSISMTGHSQEFSEPGDKLDGILRKYSHEVYVLSPLSATANDYPGFNDKLGINISEDFLQKSLKLGQRYLDTLKTLDYESLSNSQKLSVDLLKYQLSNQKDALENKFAFYRPVNQFVFSFPQQFAVLGTGAGFVPFKTETDYRNFISRMEIFKQWINQAIENMEMGLKLGDTNPKSSMMKVPEQLKPLYELEGDKNNFYKPLLSLPESMDAAAKEKLIADYNNAIDTFIRPAYKKLHDYLQNTYIPKARTSSGLIGNANGKAEYAYAIRNYTTTDMTADEIFNLGIKEVARIRKQMDSIRVVTGFKRDLKSFFDYMRTDKKFFPFKTEDEVLNRYRSFEVMMEPQLQKLFNLRPKSKFEVRPIEKFREAAANAQYMPPSRDGARPGIFYEAVPNAAKYNYFVMESLYIHEAIPGHHYQLALQTEADIPEFRKRYINSAFAEGWALYAESLGKTLGMYSDPYQYMGRLNNEIERAVRLVVDSGIHAKGWTREKAIAYVLENQPVTAEVAEQRIERYMVAPGQALSYKVGELKILALRDKAKKMLGSGFDIRECHDQVLKEGCIPLSLLERQIDYWLKSKL